MFFIESYNKAWICRHHKEPKGTGVVRTTPNDALEASVDSIKSVRTFFNLIKTIK